MTLLIKGTNDLLPIVLEIYLDNGNTLTSLPFFHHHSFLIDQRYDNAIKSQTLFDQFKTPCRTLVRLIQLKLFTKTLTDNLWLYLSQYQHGKYLDLFLLAGYQMTRSAFCRIFTAWIHTLNNQPLFQLVQEFCDTSDIHYALVYTSKQFPSVEKPQWFTEAYEEVTDLCNAIYDCLASKRCVGPHFIVQQMLGLAL